MTREDAIKVLNMVEAHGLADEAKRMAIKALEQEPCDDAISRQAAIGTIESWLSCDDYNEAERHIMRATESILYDLPSVNPQPKTGHWQKRADASGNSWHACPACGHIAHTLTRFCPDCGARLEAPS